MRLKDTMEFSQLSGHVVTLHPTQTHQYWYMGGQRIKRMRVVNIGASCGTMAYGEHKDEYKAGTQT